MSPTEEFRALHAQGMFVMPNPWDGGSARILEGLGFRALATTSAGLGRSLGKDDQQVTRTELVDHVAAVTALVDVPVSVDGERLFPDDPGGIAATVDLLADAGASGCSIEDWDPASGATLPTEDAVASVAEAAAACGRRGLVLTARAEGLLYGTGDLDDVISRLVAFRAAGADVLYAPGLLDSASIARVVAESGGPVNVLALPGTPPLPRLAELGVRRVSTGALLYNAAHQHLRAQAAELLDGLDPELCTEV